MPLPILFMPESAYGPTNNCVGIGDVLRQRGHRVVFAAEASWKGKLAPLGFEEDLVDLAPPAPDTGEQDAGPGIVQAQMTGSMSRRPDGPDIAPRYGHAVAVVQEPVRLGQVQNVGDPVRVHGEDSEILVRDAMAAQPILIAADLTLTVTPQPARKGLGFHGVHRDPRAAFAAEPAAQAVMVGVDVGDHHARDVGQRRARGVQAGGNGLAAVRGVPSGIHDHDARVADERVGQGVPQRTVRDGYRHRPQVRADLFHWRKHAPLPGVRLRGAGDVDAADGAEVGCQDQLPFGAGTATARSRKLTSRAA